MPSQQNRRAAKAKAKAKAMAQPDLEPEPEFDPAPKAKAMAKAKPKAKAKAFNEARSGPCSLPGCTETADAPLLCCGSHLCSACCFKILTVCICHEELRCRLMCPFCRRKAPVEESVVKYMMAKQCPFHAAVMKNACADGDVVVAHQACEIGCYDCAESTLRAFEL